MLLDRTLSAVNKNIVILVLEHYWSNILFPIVFAVGLIITLVFSRKRSSIVFLLETIFLLLTVYNPLVINFALSVTTFKNQYYRMFWILPVIPGVAYYGTRLMFMMRKGFERLIFVAAFLACVLWIGNPVEGISDGHFVMAENIYKVSDDLIKVLDVIHDQTENENPRIVFDSILNNDARQYDPSVIPVIHRAAAVYRSESTAMGTLNETTAWYRKQKAIMDALWYEIPVDQETFQWALEETKTEFIVVKKNSHMKNYLKDAGCIELARTGGYIIYTCHPNADISAG